MIIISLFHSSIKQGLISLPRFVLSQSFILRLFHLQNDEIEEVELPGFDSQHQTLFCTNVTSNQYIQVKQTFFLTAVPSRLKCITPTYRFLCSEEDSQKTSTDTLYYFSS